MKQDDPSKIDAIAKYIRWAISVFLLALAGFYLWTTSTNTIYEYQNATTLLQNNESILNPFHLNAVELIDKLGNPYDLKSIRESESLMYWDFEVLTLQIHLNKDKVIRAAYFAKDQKTRDSIKKVIIQQYGTSKDWKEKNLKDESNPVLVNESTRRTIVTNQDSILLYGYVMK